MIDARDAALQSANLPERSPAHVCPSRTAMTAIFLSSIVGPSPEAPASFPTNEPLASYRCQRCRCRFDLSAYQIDIDCTGNATGRVYIAQNTRMEEPPRIEGVVSSKKISTKEAAKSTKRFLQDFSTYLHDDEDEQNFEELTNDNFAPEIEGVHIHIHDQLVNFVEFHLGSSAGLKRIVEVPKPQAVIEGGIDSIIKGEQDETSVKSEDNNTGGGEDGNNKSTPKELRKLEKAKAKELKRQEKEKEKELKRQQKEQKKLAKKEKKEKRRRSKGGDTGEEAPATKKVKSEE